MGQFILSISDFGQKLRPKEEPVPSSHDKLNTRTNILFQNFLNNLDFFGDVGGGGGIQGEGHGWEPGGSGVTRVPLPLPRLHPKTELMNTALIS